MERFTHQLERAWARNDSLLCIGLDPESERLPASLAGDPAPLFAFNRAIVDATADLVCAFKPQFAHYAARGAEAELARTIEYIHGAHPGIPVILDAKRGDIGNTAQRYAAEAFDRYGADALTVNPYLGGDSLAPYLERAERGVVVLCRTSNAGAVDLQDLITADGRRVYEVVADLAAARWNGLGNCALVVGATYPRELAAVRARVGTMPLLVPGVGAQGGEVRAAVRAGQSADGTGLMISASRSILYAGRGADFSARARAAARELRDEINRHRRGRT